VVIVYALAILGALSLVGFAGLIVWIGKYRPTINIQLPSMTTFKDGSKIIERKSVVNVAEFIGMAVERCDGGTISSDLFADIAGGEGITVDSDDNTIQFSISASEIQRMQVVLNELTLLATIEKTGGKILQFTISAPASEDVVAELLKRTLTEVWNLRAESLISVATHLYS
jgi:hypothetical protein